MGQAKNRGTKEERVSNAIAIADEISNKSHLESIERQKIWDSLSHEEKKERVGAAEFWSRLQSLQQNYRR